MGIKFNPLIFGGFDLSGGGGGPAGSVEWKSPVADEASLPMSGNTSGDARVVLNTDKIYVWDDSTSKWIDTNLTTAAFGATPNAEGITLSTVNETVSGVDITRPTINLEPADATNPGAVSTSAQTFAGDKTFDNTITVVGSIDAQTSIGSSTGTLVLGDVNTTTINLGDPSGATTSILQTGAIDSQYYGITNVGQLTTAPTTNDNLYINITDSSNGVGTDTGTIGFQSSGAESADITFRSDGILFVESTKEVQVIGATQVTLDSAAINIGQVAGTTDIVGTVTIEYNPANPTNWAPAPDDVIEGLDQIANRFVSQNQVTHEPTGFPNTTDSTISFSDSSPARTFTIAPTGVSFDFYVKGTKFTKTAPESIQIPNLSGNHYIYYDASGVLNTTQVISSTLFIENAIVSDVNWNPDVSLHTYFAEERHGLTMDGATHTYLHTVFGARYLTGLALQGFTIGNGGSNSHAQFTSDQGTIRDEDLLLQIAAETQIPILYRIGQNWRKKPADAYPVIYSDGVIFTGANGRLPYNQYTGGAWTLTQVANSSYVLVHFFATNDKEHGVFGIQGIETYNSASSARIGANSEISSLSGLPFAEFVPIGSVIFETANSYGNAIKARVFPTDTGANYVDFRGTQLYVPSGQATSHGLLSGLSNDDHFQYLLADGTRAMAGALNMGTHHINNVVDPTSAQDAATKNYVDGKVADSITDGVTTIAPSQNAVHDALALKQNVGNYITALTTDVSASGPGSVSATIQPNVVSNSKLAQMPASTLKGNNTGATANASDLTTTQVTAILNTFTSTLQGLTPASGGGSSNYLRADGSWSVPSGTGVTSVSVNSANGFSGSSSGGSTPALTLNTTVTGVLKGNGSAISAATAGTDYVVPSGSITGTASNVTGIVAITNGGTGQTTQQTALNALAGATTSGQYLRGNGTNVVMAAIQASDVPTLNQNTTGSAGSVSGTNVISNSNLSQMSASTLKGNNTGATANASDLSVTDVRTLLSIIPAYSGDIPRTSFTAADNQAVAANITGLAFANATVRGFEAQITIVRNTSYAQYSLKGIQKSASWEMSQDYIGDDAGITFSITSAGQIQYTSTNTGFTGALLFRAQTV